MWLSVDSLADRYPNMTPYHFVSNNPIMRIDPKGLTDFKNTETGEVQTIEDGMNQMLSISPENWGAVGGFVEGMDGNSPSNDYNEFIEDNGGVAVPTESSGGLIPNREMFNGFMNFKAQNEEREVAAFEIKDFSTGEDKFIVQPWEGNGKTFSKNDIHFTENFGFTWRNIRELHHTHPNWGTARGSYKGLSPGDKGVFDNWNSQIPINAHFRDGDIWRLSIKNPFQNSNGTYGSPRK